MRRKRCPACGSLETVEIIYGYPSQELFEEFNRGEIVLGGCCIHDNNPQRHCTNCGQDFDGNDSLQNSNLKDLKFILKEKSGNITIINIDALNKDKVIEYTGISKGNDIDINELANTKRDFEKTTKEIVLPYSKWLKFIKELSELEISNWSNRIFSEDFYADIEWILKITLDSLETIEKSGFGVYPYNWKKLIKIFEKYMETKIIEES